MLRTRKKIIRYILLSDPKVPIFLRLLSLASVTVSLALAVTIWNLERRDGVPGIIGSSTVLVIAYACLTLGHGLFAIWLEWKGVPIGVWRSKKKMAWICSDLLFIALWSSVLSLAVSDYLASPLSCSAVGPWWITWQSYVVALDHPVPAARELCNRQAALIAFITLNLVVAVANIVLSLFRTLEKVSRAAKVHVKGATSWV